MSREEHRRYDAELARLRKAAAESPKRHPAIDWFNGAGGVSLLVGLTGLIVLPYFWWFVALIYLALTLLCIDVWSHPRLKRSRIYWRFGLSTILALIATGFSFGVVFVPAPLEIRTYAHLGNYGAGAQIAGKEWKPEWIDLRVRISNPTDYDYSDLDLWITPDLYLVDVWQKTTIPNVSFLDLVQVDIQQTPIKPAGPTQESQGNITRDAPKRVLCPVLPKHSELEIVMALKNLVPAPEVSSPPVVVTMDGPKKFPEWVRIEKGEYKLMGRPHEIAGAYKPQQFP